MSLFNDWKQVYPKAKGLIQAEGPRMPIAYELDDSLLVKDLDEVPRTPLEEGISRDCGNFRAAPQ